MTDSVTGAGELALGILRLLADAGMEGMTEVTLSNSRRADILALDPGGDIHIVEIKTSERDFRSDSKWRDYLEFCDYFYFAVPAGFPDGLLPDDQGLIVADRFGGVIHRSAERRGLAPARRKAVTLRFARKAAARLRAVCDPGETGA